MTMWWSKWQAVRSSFARMCPSKEQAQSQQGRNEPAAAATRHLPVKTATTVLNDNGPPSIQEAADTATRTDAVPGWCACLLL